MRSELTGDEIFQRVKEIEHGLPHEAFGENTVFCDHMFNRPVIHHLPVGFALYDDQFVLQKCNPRYAEYVRTYTPFGIEKALGMGHFDYKPGAAPYMEGWFVSVRNSMKPDTRCNLELRVEINHEDHVSFWDTHLEPVTDHQGRLRGFLMCCIDRTDRNLMERALEREGMAPSGLIRAYDELKTTLRVLMRAQEEERRLIESKVAYNVKQQLKPLLKRMKSEKLSALQGRIIETIEAQIDSIVSPFSMKLSSPYFGLTPREIRVAGLVKDGLTSKEIAEILNVTKECIDFHRNSIRGKLGIKGKKTNIRTHLSIIADIGSV
jgi:DNA-binding CsgD family transcriptional regulator